LAQKLIDKITQDYNTIADEFTRTRQYAWREFEALKTLINYENTRLDYAESSAEARRADKITILDVGCGNGRLAEIINKIKPVQYTGLDISEKLITNAKQRYPELNFIVSSMLKLPFPEGVFNVVAAIASLQHIPSEQLRLQALTEFHRVTKPAGLLFMTNWNLDQPKLKKYFVNQYDPGDALIPWKNGAGKILAQRYYHGFTLKELNYLLNATGWQIQQQAYSENKRNIVTVAKKTTPPSNLSPSLRLRRTGGLPSKGRRRNFSLPSLEEGRVGDGR